MRIDPQREAMCIAKDLGIPVMDSWTEQGSGMLKLRCEGAVTLRIELPWQNTDYVRLRRSLADSLQRAWDEATAGRRYLARPRPRLSAGTHAYRGRR